MIISRLLAFASCIILPFSSVAFENSKANAPVEPNKYQWIDRTPMNRVYNPSASPLVDVLVLLQDTVYGSASQIAMKQADNDTALKYMSQLIPGAAFLLRDTNQTTFPSLRAFRTVILIETSFISPSSLKRAQRDSLKAFLSAGAPGNEKSLIVFGGDFAYNYDRAASTTVDTALSRGLLKHQYLFDDGNVVGQNKMRGIAINNNLTDSLVASASNFYPDAVRKMPGSDSLSGYVGRSIRDSLGGVGYNGATYNTAVIFADPRYIAPKANDSLGGFRRVLAGALTYIRNAGGTTAVNEPSATIAKTFELKQNFPNPFNPATTFSFIVGRSSFVRLEVIDILGRTVATLFAGSLPPGQYTQTFDAARLSSGVYFYRLSTESFSETKRMLLLK